LIGGRGRGDVCLGRRPRQDGPHSPTGGDVADRHCERIHGAFRVKRVVLTPIPPAPG
jgi:hypothetical protein